ncbi:hypothetical protein LINGRAHAP2_LOCUS22081, partial [Linum grandiflorum]
ILGRPQAEPVVVLGSQKHERDSGGGSGVKPLVGVERRGVEDGRGLVASSLFGAGERVDSEVEEHDDFPLLPFELGERRQG